MRSKLYDPRNDGQEYEYFMHAETDRAVLVSETGAPDDDKIWLPKSQIDIIHIKGGRILMEVPDWLAQDKGLA